MKWTTILSAKPACNRPNGLFGCYSRIDGNELYQPLDSSFRWNDDGGEVKYLLSFRPACGWQAGMTLKVSRICLLFRRHSGEGRNLGERRRGVKWTAILSINLPATGQNSLLGCHSRIDGNELYQPLDSGLRWNRDSPRDAGQGADTRGQCRRSADPAGRNLKQGIVPRFLLLGVYAEIDRIPAGYRRPGATG